MNSLFQKTRKPKIDSVRISDIDDDSEVVTVDKIGISDLGQGIVILKTSDGKDFPISSFSAETAKNIADFREGRRNEIPSMHSMMEQICEESGLFLVKVRIFKNGQALRANLYLTGKKELILRNYRASDAIALAVFYNIPILIRKELVHQNLHIEQ